MLLGPHVEQFWERANCIPGGSVTDGVDYSELDGGGVNGGGVDVDGVNGGEVNSGGVDGSGVDGGGVGHGGVISLNGAIAAGW